MIKTKQVYKTDETIISRMREKEYKFKS